MRVPYEDNWENEPDPFAPVVKTPTASIAMDGMEIDPASTGPQDASAILLKELDTRGVYPSPFLPSTAPGRPLKTAGLVASTPPTPGPTTSGGPVGAAAALPPPEGAQGPQHKFFTAKNI
jgi:hypothetical protein